MKSALFYLRLVYSLIATLPKMVKYNKFKRTASPSECTSMANGVAGDFAKTQVENTGSRIVIEGVENIPAEGAMLFVSNHQSNFDAAIFLGYIKKDKGYVAKIELKKIPILSKWMEEIHCLFIDRDDIRQSAKVILEGVRLLKSGYSLVMFPEGTRSRGAALGQFKAGSFKLATKSGAPVVPVSISGSYRIMEANNSRIKAADVLVTIHPPICTQGLSPEEAAALPNKVRDIIISGIKDD